MSIKTQDRPALLCWDGSASARNAIRQAGSVLGPGRRATVLLAHIPVDSARGILGGRAGSDAPIMGFADAEVLLNQGVDAAEKAGFDVEALAVEADRRTAEIIVQTAEEQDACVIVMGQRGRSALGVTVLGSVARAVINSRHRPVILVSSAGSEDQTRR